MKEADKKGKILLFEREHEDTSDNDDVPEPWLTKEMIRQGELAIKDWITSFGRTKDRAYNCLRWLITVQIICFGAFFKEIDIKYAALFLGMSYFICSAICIYISKGTEINKTWIFPSEVEELTSNYSVNSESHLNFVLSRIVDVKIKENMEIQKKYQKFLNIVWIISILSPILSLLFALFERGSIIVQIV